MKSINSSAPVKCHRSITINASQEKVWAALTNIDQWANYLTFVSKPKLNGELKAGTSFYWKNAGTPINSIIHTAEPFNYFGWTGKAFGTFAIHNWTLTSSNGQTLIAADESMEGFPVVLFKKYFYKLLDNGLQSWLELLKKECEK